jgi:NitT/TauT family transport system permease protein
MTRRYVIDRTLLTLAQVGATVLALYLWQLGADHNVINPLFFSKPTAIWDFLKLWASSNQPAGHSTNTTLWQDLESTLVVFGLGYVIATGIGIVMGLLIGAVALVREVLEPFIAFMNAMPRLALLPILLVVFGFGQVAQIILVILVCVFMVMVNIATGVQDIRSDLLNNARMLGAGRLELIRHIYLPSLTIWVLSTARVTIGYAVQAAIAAEFIGAARGLGFRFSDAQSRFRSDEMFAAFAVVLLLALAVDIVLGRVEKRTTRWMPSKA